MYPGKKCLCYGLGMNRNAAGVYQQRRRRFSLVLLVLVIVLGYSLYVELAWHNRDTTANQAEKVESDLPAGGLVRATDALGRLVVRDQVLRKGYDRELFGDGWAEIKGCDMRNRILQRDLVKVLIDDDGCTVVEGVLEEDPFTGKRIVFERGQGTSGDIHIDHLVAVSDAWAKGAQNLTHEERREFYNDPLNLLAVEGNANINKENKDAADWLPREEYRCRFVARQIAVKVKYMLWVTQRELNAMKRVLQTCPDQPLPIVKGDA